MKSLVPPGAIPWRVSSRDVISALTVSIWSALATLIPIVRAVVPGTKCASTTVYGMRTWSSWLTGPVLPLACRIPTTSNGRPPIVIVEPIELAVRPRSSAVVAPRTASRSFASTAAPLSVEPCQMSKLRTCV